MDDVDVKKVLPFEHGLHTHLKTSHAALLKKIEDSKAARQGRRGRADRGRRPRSRSPSPEPPDDPRSQGARVMAAGKEIRGKIKSVENTKKITKAMEMVAASKMRKAQERMRAARPYAEQDPQPGGQPVAGHARVQAPVHDQARAGQADRRHRRHHRQGPVRRPEHQRAAHRHGQAEGAGGPGREGRDRGHRQQGSCLPQPHRREGRLACDPAGRQAAPGQAGRPGEGAARCLCRRVG